MTRPYVHELCAAYNAARRRDDVEWFVDSSGNLRIGDAPGFIRENNRRIDQTKESERARWMRNYLNNKRTSVDESA